jgi:transposase
MKKVEKMQVINAKAAGIDIGSKSHFVAIGQESHEVKEFSVYSSGQESLLLFLKEHEITTVAMESTGSYWQSLFRTIQQAGIEVLLVSGTQTKNVRGKTDVQDCQWIQKLHTLGLLRGCYLPGETTLKLRTLSRHRQSLIEISASFTNKMQKALRLMNLRLDVVLSDITGVSGIRIIEAILAGEKNPETLSLLANNRVRKSKHEIVDALQGQWNQELLYELESSYKLYKDIQLSIAQCDKKVEALLTLATSDIKDETIKNLKKKQLKGKNQQRFDLPMYSHKLFGVDLFAIQGVSSGTVMTFISEVGLDIYKFDSAKQFTSWLRLAPNNKISGGKLISSRTPKGKNKFTHALRNAANTIDRLKGGAMNSFFKRIAYKKGRAAAITATARKLAVIIWNMVMKKQAFNPMSDQLYQELYKHKQLNRIKKMMTRFNITTKELSGG